MNRRNFIKTAALAAGSLILPRPAFGDTQTFRRPNVLLFFTDDQGTLDANCYGSKDLYTPAMDNLAKNGIRLTQAYAHTVCCPARALLLTGRHPQRSGINSWAQSKPEAKKGINMNLKELTLAEALKRAGYRTAIFGKWHLGAALGYGPTAQGFDEFYGLRDGFIDNYNHYQLHGKGFHDLYRAETEVFDNGKYFPDLVVNEANHFLKANKNNPFFLYVAFNVPHYPEQADKKFDKRYEKLPMPRRSYAKMISTTDDRMGQVLTKLDELGLRENTIVIFMSDNGHSSENYKISIKDHNSGLAEGTDYGPLGGGGNTGKWRGAKGSFFEGGIRVPAVISFPSRLPKNIVRDQAVTVADFYPTILELCSVPLPDRKLDGQSLMPIIKSDKAPSHHKVMYWQWQNTWAVREGDWKLIVNGSDTTDQWQGHPQPKRHIPNVFLGNLADDEPELKNYADEHPNIVRHLTELHQDWIKDVFHNRKENLVV